MIIASCCIIFIPDKAEKNTVIAFGSSSLNYMAPKIQSKLKSLGYDYVSDAIGGQIIETMSAHQGSNPIRIKFTDEVIKGSKSVNHVEIIQKKEIGSLRAKGSFPVLLSNGVKGNLNLNKKTFTTINEQADKHVGTESIGVDFGYYQYRNKAIHIFNIGKNNITMGNYTEDQVFDAVVDMITYTETSGNNKYVVCGYFVDTNMPLKQKKVVLEVNKKLKEKYGSRYFDIQEIIVSKKIWNDLGKTPNIEDLNYQQIGDLAPQLSRNSNHLSEEVDTVITNMLIEKLKSLKYI